MKLREPRKILAGTEVRFTTLVPMALGLLEVPLSRGVETKELALEVGRS